MVHLLQFVQLELALVFNLFRHLLDDVHCLRQRAVRVTVVSVLFEL